jgi:transcriptional regulator with XRE-family HTH domain
VSRGSERTERRAPVTGYLFKLIRESIPMTQEALAQDLQMDRRTIQGWETGRRPVTAVPVAQAAALRHRLAVLGARPALLDHLDVAAEADYLISQIVGVAPGSADLEQHPLGWTVLTHTLTEMVAWPITGRTPEALRANETAPRRGPVPRSPFLTGQSRAHFFGNLRMLADRAQKADGPVVLLRRQAHFLLGLDQTGSSSELLDRAKTVRYLSQAHGWSPLWPAARSLAASLARQGDIEPLRHFISNAHPDEQCELAGLNYWAHWVGETPGRQRTDMFMVRPDHDWRGTSLLRHIIRRMDSSNGFRDLYVHTLFALVKARPGLVYENRSVARSLYLRGARLLDEDSLSTQSRRELAGVLSGIHGRVTP